jgi:hypothetical protein
MKKEEGNDHYIEDLEEWQNNQYNPGYYLGGKIPGNLLYSGQPKKIGALLVGIGITTLIPFVLVILEFFQDHVPRLPLEYLLFILQALSLGGFSIVLIYYGVKKIVRKAK